MRTYGRIYVRDSQGAAIDPQPAGYPKWVEVDTDAAGFNDMVWLTTLIQTLKMFLGESPFYANYGIPANTAVIQQIAPDYYMARTQQQFAQYFASLILAREPGAKPTYRISVTTHQGVKLNVSVPVPV